MPDSQSWFDYAQSLPPGIPDVAYDAQRERYFDSVVRPWAHQQGLSPSQVREEFMSKTGRPDKAAFPRVELAAKSAAKALLDPIAGLAGQRDVQGFLAEKEQGAVVEAQRQGINPTPYSLIGSMAGQLPYWYAGMELAGLAATSVAPLAIEGGTVDAAAALAKQVATKRLFNTAAGAAIQGGYDAAKAQDGHRLLEGAIGAAEGAAGVAVIEYAKPLWQILRGKHGLAEETAKAVDAVSKGVADETQTEVAAKVVENDPAVVGTVNEVTKKAAEAGKKRGRPKRAPVAEPTAKAVQVEVALPQAAEAVPVTFDPKDIPQAAETISQALTQGGSIEGISGDPTHVDELLRQVDSHSIPRGEFDIGIELRGEPGPTASNLVLPLSEEVAAETAVSKGPAAEAAPAATPELPANPLIASLREVLLNPKLSEAQKSASRIRLQRLSPETVSEIDAQLARPKAGAAELPSSPLGAPVEAPVEDVSAELAKAQELSRLKAKEEGIGQPTGQRLGLQDVSEFDQLEVLKNGKVRDVVTGKIYANADQALRAKGLSAPDRFAEAKGPEKPVKGKITKAENDARNRKYKVPPGNDSFWVSPKGKADYVGDHGAWVGEELGADKTFQHAFDRGYLRVSGPAVDVDITHVSKSSAGLEKAVELASEQAKASGQNSIAVHVGKAATHPKMGYVGESVMSGEVKLDEVGEFLESPMKYLRRREYSWSREQRLNPDKFATEWAGRDDELHSWVTPEGKIKPVEDHGTWAMEQLGWKRDKRAPNDASSTLRSQGFVRIASDSIEASMKASDEALDAALAKVLPGLKSENKKLHIYIGDKGVSVSPASFDELAANPKKFVMRYGQEGSLQFAGAESGRPFMKGEGGQAETFVTDRPLQTRVTGNVDEFLPEGTAAGTSAPEGQKPIIYYRNPNPTNMFHERLHGHFGNLGLTEALDSSVREHLIGSMMEEAFSPELKKLYGQLWPEEAYVYAASAIRTSNDSILQRFIDADTDRASVMQWVADTSEDMLRGIAEKPDSVHKLVAERGVREVVRRATGELDAIARGSVDVLGDGLEMEGGRYVVVDREGVKRFFDDRAALVEHLEKNYEQPLSAPQLVDESLIAPDVPRYAVDHPAHSLGKAPINTEPPSPTVMDNLGRPEGGRVKGGMQTFSNFVRPFYAWLATVARKNKWPELYTTFKALDEAVVSRDNFRAQYDKVLVDVFKGVKEARRSDFYRWMETATEDKEKVAKELQLTDKEIGKLNKLRTDFFDPLASEFGISADKYLQNYAPRIRAANLDPDAVKASGKLTSEDVDFFAEHVRTGELDPRDTDMLRVADTYLRLGARKKMMEPAIERAAKMINLKTPSGEFVTGSLQPLLKRHIESIRGVPDFTSQMIDGAANVVKESINDFLGTYNSKVHSSLQIEPIEATPRDIMSKWILLQYAGSMGGRAMVPFRDFLQTWITSYPILGGKYLAVGAKKAFEEGAYATALREGGLMWDNPMKALYSQTEAGATGKLGKAAEISLTPLKWSNNISRLISFWGHTERAKDAIASFKQSGNIKQLMRESAMTWLDESLQKRFAQEIADGADVTKTSYRIAKELTDVAHWNYRAGANPGIYKYTLGRLFGQYGTWPMNYIEYVRRLVGNGDKVEVAKAVTRLVLAHGAIIKAGHMAGVDTAQWVFTQPMAYGGGPLMQAVVNLPGTMDFETYKGAEARRSIVRPLWPGSIPGGMEMQKLHKALVEDDPDVWKIMMGFHPLSDKEAESGVHQVIP